MEVKHLRIGLIGCGFMGKTHLFAVRNLPFFYCTADESRPCPFQAEVVAVSAANPSHAQDFARQFSIPRSGTVEELMADGNIDIMDICTPNTSHADLIRLALENGKHVLCEKPLTTTVREAEELLRLSENSPSLCGMVFNNRFLLPVMKAGELIRSGRLGRILSFDFAYRHNSCIDPSRFAGWKQRASFGGGTLADLGPHVIDLCRCLCGNLTHLSAHGQIAFPTHRTADGGVFRTDADEAFYLTGVTENGAVGTITVSKLTQGANDDLTFSVYGTDGSLSFSLMDMNYLRFYDAHDGNGMSGYRILECAGRYPSPATGFPSVKAPAGWLRGHMGCLHDYLSAVAEGHAPSAGLADGVYVQRVIEAARESDRTKREVKLC